jgi:hypothetical protein
MKARIKGTNTIVECIRIDGFFGEKGKGVYCQYINGEHPGAYETIPGDCLIEIENDFDWQSFRAEAAKDILCHLLNDRYSGDGDNNSFVMQAIGIADELIKQLKEKEEK